MAEVKKEAVKTAPKTAAAKPAKKENSKQIKITLVKSTCKCSEKQKRTVEALGLKKIRSERIISDNDAVRGMIFVVKHLINVEEVK